MKVSLKTVLMVSAMTVFAGGASLSARAMTSDPEAVTGEDLTADAVSIKERVFAKLHSTDVAEIAQSQIAVTKSKNAKVIAQAQDMIRDHSDGERQLLAFAARTRTQVREFVPVTPAEIADKRMEEEAMNQLARTQGAAFDLVFINANVDAHMKVYNWLNEKLPLLMPEDRAFVMMQMNVIHRHYEMLIQIQKEITKP